MNQITKKSIKIFPNPDNEIINIQIDNYKNRLEITFYDVIRRVLYQGTVDFMNQYKISVVGLDSGIYFLSFVINNTIVAKKIRINKN